MANATPPPAGLQEKPTARTTLSIEGVMAECVKRGHDPHEVMAKVFDPAIIDDIGHEVAAKFALELLKLEKGQKVQVDATLDYGHSDVSLSDAERILSEALGQGQASTGKAPSTK